MSSQHDNLLLSTLTGGMMGVGEAINGAEKASSMRATRAEGVLIKPDVPILLTDRTTVAEAQGKTNPSMATTYSDHTGGRTTYVFGFTSSSASLSFTPAELGYSSELPRACAWPRKWGGFRTVAPLWVGRSNNGFRTRLRRWGSAGP